jgi:hypothetical protein
LVQHLSFVVKWQWELQSTLFLLHLQRLSDVHFSLQLQRIWTKLKSTVRLLNKPTAVLRKLIFFKFEIQNYSKIYIFQNLSDVYKCM